MKTYLRIFIALLFFSTVAKAQVTFSSLGGPNGGDIGDIEINSSGHLFVMATSQQGPFKPSSGSVYRSIDNGVSWTKLSTGTTGLADREANDIMIDASDNIYILGKFKIYKSTAASNGDAWTFFTPSSPFTGASSGSLLAKTTTGALYFMSTTTVLRSLDDGATWSLLVGGLPSTNYVSIIASGNDVYLGVLNSGTYKLTNNGAAWSAFNSGLSLPDQASSFALRGTTLYQTNRNGAYYYNTGTSLWTQIASQIAVAPNTLNEDFNSGGHTIRSGAGTKMVISFSNGNVYYSNNATSGAWTQFSPSNIGDNSYAMNVFSGDVYLGYSREGIIKSSNFSTWNDNDNGIYLSPGQSFVRANGTELMFISNGGRRLSASSSGNNWNKFNLNFCNTCSFSSLFKLANGDLYAIGTETYKSVDNGSNWADVGGPPGSVYTQQSVTGDETKFYAYSSSGSTAIFYVSTNKAVSFSTLAVTGLPTSYQVRRIAADAANNLYIQIFNNNNSKNEVYKVVNAATAANIITSSTVTDVSSIQALGSAIYIAGRNAANNRLIAKSTDGGGTWSFISINSLNDFLVLSTSVIFVGDNNGNQNTYTFSNDGGATFSAGFVQPSDTRLIGGTIDANGHALLALQNGPMFTSDQAILKPATPTALAAIATGVNTTYLTWTHDGLYVDRFNVERKLTSASTFDSVGVVNSTTDRYYHDSGLIKNTSYTYRLAAIGASGTSYSSPITVVTKDICAPLLTIPDNRSWTGVVAGGFTNTAIGIRKLNNEQYSITDVTAGSLAAVVRLSGGTFGTTTVPTTIYENCAQPFMVDASSVYPNGNGTWNGTNTLVLNFQIDKSQYTATSKTITLTLNTNDPAPLVPTTPTAYVFDNTSIQLEWSADLYQKKFLIFRSTTSGSGFAQIGTVDYPALKYKDTGPLTAGTTYYYKIQAQNGNASPLLSPFTAELSVPFNTPKFVLATNVVTATSGNAASATWADFNNDGLEDLIMPTIPVNGSTTNEPMLFQNTGTDFTLLSGKFSIGQGYITPTVGDYDNDGFLDIYMTTISLSNTAATKFSLYRNAGGFNFTEITADPLLTVPGALQGAFNSSWVDFDRDGKLDLFVANQDAGSQLLLKGNGAGSFTKVTGDPLVTDPNDTGDANWADYDNNGTPDVLVVESGAPDASKLFKNTAGTFTKVAASGMDGEDTQKLFTISWGDYDNDQDLDVFVGNQQGANYLYNNNGAGAFTKVAATAGQPTEAVVGSTFSSAWGDVDNDGDLDLFVAGGFGFVNALFLNNGSGVFTKVKGEMLTSYFGFNISAAMADYNKDGLLDLAVGNLSFSQNNTSVADPGPVKLFKNNGTPGNWLQLKLVGTTSNKAAIGARVKMTTGVKNQIREVSSHTGFASQNSLLVHFGLGSSTKADDITITWPSGIIQHLTNVNSNQFVTITEDNVGPVATTLVPANAATNVNANSTLSLTLNEASAGVASKFIKFFKTSDLVTAVASIDASTATVVGNVFTFAFPANLSPSTSYSISVDAGAFKDIYGNQSLAMASSVWQFTTAPGPVVSLLNPVNAAINIPVNTKIEITFDKAPTAVATKKITVTVHGAGAPEFSADVTTGTIVGNKVSFTPTANMGFLKTYDVAVDAGAFTDASGNQTAAITWSFGTKDNVAPVLVYNIIPASVNKAVTGTLSGTITDNSGVVASATLTYRKIGGGDGWGFKPVAGTPDLVTTNQWNFDITPALRDEMGIEYFLSAKDAAGNRGRLPLDTGSFYTYTNYTDAQSIIRADAIGYGGKKENWKIFTVPFELGSNTGISSILDELNDDLNDKTKGRILSYVNTTAWAEFPTDVSTFTRGKGYFINIRTTHSGNITTGNVVAPANNRQQLFQLALVAGWNQIGNPYTVPISWTDVSTFNGLSGAVSKLKKFTSGTYANATGTQQLLAFEGAFVFADAAQTISIPFVGQTAIGGRMSDDVISGDFGQDQWLVKLSLQQNDLVNDLSGFGMHPDASLSLDKFDDINPPKFIDYIEMDFPHQEFFAKNFSVDVVPTAKEFTWNFTVDANSKEESELIWDNTAFSQSPRDLYLFDVAQQVAIDMKDVNRYRFDPKASADFRIYYGDDLASKIKPDRITIKAYPNPTSGKSTLAFTLPDQKSSYHVRLEVYDMVGNKVSTLTEGDYKPGFYNSEWNVLDGGLSNGVYIYRFTVAGKDKTEIQNGKIILNK
jgi:ASPIC and UnbV/Bacterial Ig-like domain/FG-GAP-like repeat